MTIANQAGVTGYRRTQAQRLEGAPGEFHDPLTRPIRNPLLAQITNLAIGTFGDDGDTITATIETPDGEVHEYTILRAAGVPVDAAAAAAALETLINADEDMTEVVDATSPTTNLLLTFRHPNIVYPVEHSESGVTVTETETQAPGGSSFPFGRFVIAGDTLDGVTAIDDVGGVTDEYDVIGVTLRPIGQFANAGSALASAVDGIEAGCMGDAAYKGPITMRNNGSVASAIGGTVHVVTATTGGDELGEARADADGAAQVATITVVADHQFYQVKAAIRVNGELRTLDFSYGPTDGTTSAADGVDGLEAAAAAAIIAQGFTGIISASAASGDPTFTLTAAAGYAFEYVDGSAFGEDTEAESLTVSVAAAANYTIALSRGRARWAEVVQPGELGLVHLDL